MEDHLHNPHQPASHRQLADFVKEIKTGTAHWIKENAVFGRFSHWQEGYGAFTCSQREIAGLMEYISEQEQHHGKTNFEEDYRKLLLEAGVEFDEGYIR